MLETIVKSAQKGSRTIYQLKLPESLSSRFEAGELEVIGAIIKSKETGKIVGHLQQTAFNGTADLAEILSPFMGVANIAASVANLGVSIGILYKVTKIEKTLETISQKLDYIIEDKFRSELTKLDGISQHFASLMELGDPKGQAENFRTELLKIETEIFHNLSQKILSDDASINIEFFIKVIDAISLCHKLSMLTYFVTNDLKAGEQFGLREIDKMKELFIRFIDMENKFGGSVIWGILDNPFDLDSHESGSWQPYHKKSEYDGESVKELNICFRNYFNNLASQISLAESLRNQEIPGFDLLVEAGKTHEEPIMFFPAKHILT